MKRIILSVIVLSFLLSSCSSLVTDEMVQTAIAKTQLSQITNTPVITFTPKITSMPFPTSTLIPTPTLELEYFLGDTTHKDGYSLTALSIQDPFVPANYFPQNDKNMKFVAIEIIASNISGDPLVYTGSTAKVIDTEGFSYSSTIIPSNEPSIFYVSLLPGERIKQVLFFEVPITSVLSKIKISSSLSQKNREIAASLRSVPEGHISLADPISQIQDNNLPSLGTQISLRGYNLTALAINSAAEPTNSNFYKTGYKFVAVQIILENKSGFNPLNVNSGNAYLVDNNGFIYPAIYGIAEEITTGNLAIGEKTRGWVLFRIPNDSVPYGFKYLVDLSSDDCLLSGLSQ